MPKSKGRQRPKPPAENDVKFKDELREPKNQPLSQKDRFWKAARQYLRSGMQSPWDWMNANDGVEAAQESQEDYFESMEDFYQQNPAGVPGGGSYIGDETAAGQAPASPYAQQGMVEQMAPPTMEGFFPPPTEADQYTQDLIQGTVTSYPDQVPYAPRPEVPVPQGAPQAVSGQPTSGGKLSIPQAYQTFRSAGFDDGDARMMTAIAMGESGLNPQAHNPNAGTGDNSYGLTQINMLGDLGPSRLQQFGIQNNEQLFDPLTNAKAAFAVSGGGENFGPWSVYKKGIHQQYMDDVQAALASMAPQLATDPNAPAPTSSPPPATPAPPATEPPTEEEEDEEDDD